MAKKKIEQEVVEHEDYMSEPSEVVWEDNSMDISEVVENGAPGIYNRTEDGKYQREEATEHTVEQVQYEETPTGEVEVKTTKVQWQTVMLDLYKSPEEEKRVKHLHRFYSIETVWDKQAECEKLKKIELDNYAIVDVLRELGFCRYDQPNGSFEYVKISDNIITLIRDQQMIVDAFEDYVRKLPNLYYEIDGGDILERFDRDTHTEYKKPAHITITSEMLLQKVYKNIMYYFSSTLPRLRPDKPIRLLQDTKESKYLFYNNCVVRVTKYGISIWRYDMIDAIKECYGEENGTYIWSTNILDRDFPTSYVDEQGNSKLQGKSDFEIFADCICGLGVGFTDINGIRETRYIAPTKDTDIKVPFLRKQSLQNIFGYLMHNNYECNLRSIMFIDMNKDNIGKPAGGTGKGIIGKALSHMMNRTENDVRYIAPPGKNFDPEDERRYSEGDITTQLIHIEDIKSGFRFEGFFNDVTDGAVFRKMYQDKTKHRVKIMLSSNQAIDLSAPSCKRRMVVFELDNFFNENKTPQDLFGKRFFESQWDELDWYRFDIFMVGCCLQYMKDKDAVGADGKVIGIRQPPLLNYQNTLLYSKVNEDFIVWFEDKISDALKFQTERFYSKKGLYEEFSKKYTEFADERRYKRAFAGWCKFYLQTMQIPSGEKRSTEDLLILYPQKGDPKISYIYK